MGQPNENVAGENTPGENTAGSQPPDLSSIGKRMRRNMGSIPQDVFENAAANTMESGAAPVNDPVPQPDITVTTRQRMITEKLASSSFIDQVKEGVEKALRNSYPGVTIKADYNFAADDCLEPLAELHNKIQKSYPEAVAIFGETDGVSVIMFEKTAQHRLREEFNSQATRQKIEDAFQQVQKNGKSFFVIETVENTEPKEERLRLLGNLKKKHPEIKEILRRGDDRSIAVFVHDTSNIFSRIKAKAHLDPSEDDYGYFC